MKVSTKWDFATSAVNVPNGAARRRLSKCGNASVALVTERSKCPVPESPSSYPQRLRFRIEKPSNNPENGVWAII